MLVARFAWVSIDTESSFHSPLGLLGRIKWPLHVSVYVCLCVCGVSLRMSRYHSGFYLIGSVWPPINDL